MNSGVYKVTSPSNKMYIGQSKNIDRRIKEYKKMSNCNGQSKLYLSFLKHGAENHSYEVLEICDLEVINERERYWQEHFDCIKEGLNCCYVKTNEKKMLVSDEVRKKMSLSAKGKKHSPEHVAKRVLSKKGYSHSLETRQKIADKRSKLLLDFSTGIFYKNTLEASEALNMNRVTFQAMICGRNKNRTSLIYV
jgi:group I intron endonuclease